MELGELSKISIGHDAANLFADWCLDSVDVSNEAGDEWSFPCHRWIGKGKEDAALERDLYPEK